MAFLRVRSWVLSPWAPAWADLVPLLARAELRGELRRGYFVEGLSGVQYATEEAASELARLAGLMALADDDVLLSASDPANLYGGGAPFDIPLIDGGTARLVRTAGQFSGHSPRPARAGDRGLWQAPHRAGFGVAGRA